MNRKYYFSFLALALTLVATVAFVVGHNNGTRAASVNAALAALPPSDFVISIDVQRALNETLPTLLASSPAILAKMNTHLDKLQREMGINPRQFESLAIGGRLDPARHAHSRTVVIARGSFKADELLETAFATAKARGEKFQRDEELYEGKRIFLISPPEKTGAAAKGSVQGETINRSVKERMAITVLDGNTLALGDLEGVRASIDASLGRGRVDDELIRLATQQPNAVIGFSGKLPPSVAEKASRNNTVEKYIAAIRQFYGSFGVSGNEVEASVALRTETAEQARDIGLALNAIKTFSGFGFAQSSSGPSPVTNSIGDVLKGLSITTTGNEVQIDLKLPQASFAPLMRTF
jgi:hypothetical protein